MPFSINFFIFLASDSVSRILFRKNRFIFCAGFLLSINSYFPENLFKNDLL